MHVLAEVEQDDTLPSFSAPIVCPFHGLFSATSNLFCILPFVGDFAV